MCTDGMKEPLNDASDPLVKQEKLVKASVKDMNTVFEIGLSVRRSIAGAGGSGGTASIELDVGPIGEEPIEGDQNEVGKDFLFDTALGLGVTVLDDEDSIAKPLDQMMKFGRADRGPFEFNLSRRQVIDADCRNVCNAPH